ncbi:MAG: 23S rRNA (cytosine1962-C5)-methyltransferase [Parcubacteria bacterium C7867-001]|nr:MAG: 23S rRNA (cytosine1962-C5)-methyltransferase [Parcubacteria bacterium C7867-001]
MEKHLSIEDFSGYELLDSGDHMKLERFGYLVLSRPDTQAIWKKSKPELWGNANAEFVWENGKGAWKKNSDVPESWTVAYTDALLYAKLTNFKHVGLFPEQAANWSWTDERIKTLKKPKVLNLFGYTGAASVLAAKAGAEVTHVDSSKASLAWCKENAEASGLAEDAIRYIHEDVRTFVKREVKRGAKYDGILLDPPAFGRGAKDEVWKIEEDLLPLMEQLKELLGDASGSFFLLNGYAAGYSPLSFKQLVQSVFANNEVQYGELRIPETDSTRFIPAGMYVRFVR